MHSLKSITDILPVEIPVDIPMLNISGPKDIMKDLVFFDVEKSLLYADPDNEEDDSNFALARLAKYRKNFVPEESLLDALIATAIEKKFLDLSLGEDGGDFDFIDLNAEFSENAIDENDLEGKALTEVGLDIIDVSSYDNELLDLEIIDINTDGLETVLDGFDFDVIDFDNESNEKELSFGEFDLELDNDTIPDWLVDVLNMKIEEVGSVKELLPVVDILNTLLQPFSVEILPKQYDDIIDDDEVNFTLFKKTLNFLPDDFAIEEVELRVPDISEDFASIEPLDFDIDLNESSDLYSSYANLRGAVSDAILSLDEKRQMAY